MRTSGLVFVNEIPGGRREGSRRDCTLSASSLRVQCETKGSRIWWDTRKALQLDVTFLLASIRPGQWRRMWGSVPMSFSQPGNLQMPDGLDLLPSSVPTPA